MVNKKGIIIPGARKAGTSSLYNLLIKNEKICIPSSKETQYFSLDKKIIERNKKWYLKSRNIKNNEEKYWIDASTFYLFDEKAPEKIKYYVDNPKIIIVLRDRAERTYSAFLEMEKKVSEPEKRDFSRLVGNLSPVVTKNTNLKDAEKKQIKKAKKNGKIDPNYLGKNYLQNRINFPDNSIFEDKMLVYKYFTNSLYRDHISRYKSKMNSVLVVRLENMISNTGGEMERIFEFLGLENKFAERLPQRNETKIPKEWAKSIIRAKRSIKPISKIVSKLMNISYVKSLVDFMGYSSKKKLNVKDKKLIEKMFEKELHS
jgi:hypothetical protein